MTVKEGQLDSNFGTRDFLETWIKWLAAGPKETPVAITRFPCGISSPMNTKLRVKSMNGHGSLEQVLDQGRLTYQG